MTQSSLFDENRYMNAPLADRMRPTTLEEYAGQSHLLADGKILKRMIDRDEVQSMIAHLSQEMKQLSEKFFQKSYQKGGPLAK